MKRCSSITFILAACLSMGVQAGNQELLQAASERANKIADQVRKQLIQEAGPDGVQISSARFRIDAQNRVTIIDGKGVFMKNARMLNPPTHGGRITNGTLNMATGQASSGVLVRGGGAALAKVKPILSDINEPVNVIAITFDEAGKTVVESPQTTTSHGGGAYLIYW